MNVVLQFRFLLHDSPDVKLVVYSRLADAIPYSFADGLQHGLPNHLLIHASPLLLLLLLALLA